MRRQPYAPEAAALKIGRQCRRTGEEVGEMRREESVQAVAIATQHEAGVLSELSEAGDYREHEHIESLDGMSRCRVGVVHPW